jgi:TonB family protein
MTPLAGVIIRASFVLLIGLLLEGGLRRRSAALRHGVLTGAIAMAAAVVPLSLFGPSWDVPLPATPGAAMVRSDVRATANTPAVVTGTAAAASAPSQPAAQPSAIPAAAAAIALYLSGATVSLIVLGAGLARLMRITSRARRVRDPRWAPRTAALAQAYGLGRTVVILQTDAPDLLATWGVFRPCVLLPSHAPQWSDDRVDVVLAHELAHIRRCDWAVQIAAEAMKALLWFNPLMWIACTRLRRASEQACDDVVLGHGIAARDYATHLLELARNCRKPGWHWASAVPMARPSTLERRIADMLNAHLDRRPLTRRAAAVMAALLLAVTLPSAALRAVQALPTSLSGAVYDTTGAVIPGVQLTLEDVTQMKFQAVTNASGRFTFANVQPGRYVLSAAIPGFRELRQEFDLRAASDWDRAITLQVGVLRESITVSSKRTAPPAAAAQSSKPQPIRVGGNIRVPRKLVDVRPIYPSSMRDAGREGSVPLEAIIGQDGNVLSVRVVSAEVHPDFAIAAVDAVRQWKFSPTLLNGAPVEVVMSVKIDFKLDQ